MIKRTYFMMVHKVTSDGSIRGYSSNEQIITIRSWLPDPIRAFNQGKRDAMVEMATFTGDAYVVISFNRI